MLADKGKWIRATATRVLRGLRRFVFGALLAAVATSLVALLAVVVVALMNDEYFARLTERATLRPARPVADGGAPPVMVRIAIHEFDEKAGRARASLFAYTRDPDYQHRLQHDSLHLYVVVSDGVEVGGVGDLVRQRLTFAPDTIPNIAFGQAKSNVVEFSPRFSTDVSIFPLDTYEVRLLVMVTTRQEYTPNYAIEVEKSYLGRTFAAEGSSREVQVFAGRPRLDRIVVISSSLLFLALCLVVGHRLWAERDRLSGFNESIALAGFLLAALGFREFAGLSTLPSRSVLDVLLFIPALTLLLVAFVLAARRARRAERAASREAGAADSS